MTVEALKEAIAELPAADRFTLACWLNTQTADDWDRQMERDFAPGGRGSQLAARVHAGMSTGMFHPMTGRPASRIR